MKKTNILENLEYNENKVLITPLMETEISKEIRIVFKKDQIMKEHKAGYPISVEIFEGEIDFGVDGNIYNLIKGDIVVLEANVKHDLKANADSIVRLTLSKKDTVNRVKGVLKL
ncbi:cupin domain-containing protein [Poseidonibacter antarcticus]|uniref:cupin domain-containing protein n=1 Tax=Poseidonibacter antarcticus TaxID=2478538 RepID=UPI000EF51C72|nr:cupin domain-containing protein [Poseidonibacter antarcticus]